MPYSVPWHLRRTHTTLRLDPDDVLALERCPRFTAPGRWIRKLVLDWLRAPEAMALPPLPPRVPGRRRKLSVSVRKGTADVLFGKAPSRKLAHIIIGILRASVVPRAQDASSGTGAAEKMAPHPQTPAAPQCPTPSPPPVVLVPVPCDWGLLWSWLEKRRAEGEPDGDYRRRKQILVEEWNPDIVAELDRALSAEEWRTVSVIVGVTPDSYKVRGVKQLDVVVGHVQALQKNAQAEVGLVRFVSPKGRQVLVVTLARTVPPAVESPAR